MRRISITAIALWVAVQATAQNEADVQRYTSQNPPGTARFGAMGGAFTALGGDLSSAHINPAGIGVFRFSEISFTPIVENNLINTQLFDSPSSGLHNQFAIANAGVVLVNEVNDPFWRSVNVGISLNRLNTFNDELVTRGTVPLNNSLMQSFVNEATGDLAADLSLFGAGLAYDAFIIDPVAPENALNRDYIGRVTQGEMIQNQRVQRSGRMNDFAITVGGNYDDKLFIGGGLGVVSSYYEMRSEISESPTLPGNTDLVRYRWNEDLVVEGFGVNFRAGFIYRTSSGLRIGGSVQTPTTMRLQDVYRVSVISVLSDPDETISDRSPDDFLEYRVRTPWRFTAGLAGVVGEKAIISGQYEFVNFRGAQMLPSNRRSSGNPWGGVNETIRDEFRAQHTLRVGGEYRVNRNFSMRGGGAVFPNMIPVNASSIEGNLNRWQLGGGLGYRKSSWNIDFAYTYSRIDEPYQVSNAGPIQELRNAFGIFSLTLGFRL